MARGVEEEERIEQKASLTDWHYGHDGERYQAFASSSSSSSSFKLKIEMTRARERVTN